MRKLFVYFLWTLLFVTVIGIAGAFYAIDKGWIGYMPPIEDLQNPINRFATQIYSADGKIIGTWNYNRENRVMVDYRVCQSRWFRHWWLRKMHVSMSIPVSTLLQ